MSKKVLFSLTRKDFEFDFFNGTGNGGQYRNKHANCCRCKHPASGAVGQSQEFRSLEQNKQMAFRRCAESEVFKKWVKLKASEIDSDKASIDEIVDKEIKQAKVEIREKGKWVNEDN